MPSADPVAVKAVPSGYGAKFARHLRYDGIHRVQRNFIALSLSRPAT
jgi:hypothetical protein